MLTRVDFYTHVVSATVFKPFGMFLNDNARWIKREQWSASFYILIWHVLKRFIKKTVFTQSSGFRSFLVNGQCTWSVVYWRWMGSCFWQWIKWPINLADCTHDTLNVLDMWSGCVVCTLYILYNYQQFWSQSPQNCCEIDLEHFEKVSVHVFSV